MITRGSTANDLIPPMGVETRSSSGTSTPADKKARGKAPPSKARRTSGRSKKATNARADEAMEDVEVEQQEVVDLVQDDAPVVDGAEGEAVVPAVVEGQLGEAADAPAVHPQVGGLRNLATASSSATGTPGTSNGPTGFATPNTPASDASFGKRKRSRSVTEDDIISPYDHLISDLLTLMNAPNDDVDQAKRSSDIMRLKRDCSNSKLTHLKNVLGYVELMSDKIESDKKKLKVLVDDEEAKQPAVKGKRVVAREDYGKIYVFSKPHDSDNSEDEFDSDIFASSSVADDESTAGGETDGEVA